MLNPFGSTSNSYFDLKKRIIQRMKSAKIDDEIFKVTADVFEQALNAEGVVLSRPEKQRLLSQVLKAVLNDMLTKLDGGK